MILIMKSGGFKMKFAMKSIMKTAVKSVKIDNEIWWI